MKHHNNRGLGVTMLMVLVSVSLSGPSCLRRDDASQPVSAQIDLSSAAFEAVWQRTDAPVAEGITGRTWIWGPSELGRDASEAYAEAPGGHRAVRYFDKSRMELTDPAADPADSWYVTNGLLVVELMTGRRQVGDTAFEERSPAELPVAGDPDSIAVPTYATLRRLVDLPPRADGSALIERVSRDGSISEDADLAGLGVRSAQRVTVAGIDHQVASVFWDFMNSTGLVRVDGETREELLFESPFFATGYPLTEAYWVTASLGGSERTVLFQAFERRVLTYSPENPEGWRVESGNVGAHYFDWLYAAAPRPVSTLVPLPPSTAMPSATALTPDTPAPSPAATATDPPPIDSSLVPIGDGAVDAWMRSVVRDGEDRLWVVAVDNNPARTGTGPGRLVLYRATEAGIPTGFELVHPAVVESASENSEIVSADAALDANDRLHIVWVDRGSAAAPVMYGVFDLVSVTWLVRAERLDDSNLPGFGADPGQGGVSIAFDPEGSLRVAYVVAGNHTQIRVRERSGSGWSEPAEPLLREGSFVWHPVLAVGPDGTWHLAAYDATRNDILAARDAGQGWSQATVVAPNVLGPESVDQGPAMLVDADGIPHVLYVDAGSNLRLSAQRGSVWQDVDVGGDYFTHAPGLGLFADGTLVSSGHDEFHPPHGMNVIFRDHSGWSAWEQIVALEADGSAVFRWAGAFSEPSRDFVDLVFFDEDLNNDGQFEDQRLYYIAIARPSD